MSETTIGFYVFSHWTYSQLALFPLQQEIILILVSGKIKTIIGTIFFSVELSCFLSHPIFNSEGRKKVTEVFRKFGAFDYDFDIVMIINASISVKNPLQQRTTIRNICPKISRRNMLVVQKSELAQFCCTAFFFPYLYQKGKKAEVGLLFSKEKEASQSCIFLPIVFFRIKKDSKIQCEDISFEFNKETATLTIHNIATFDCSTFNWPVLLERNKSLYRFAYPFLSVCLSKTYHFLMAANTEPKEKPKKKSWWYWIIVLVALGIFASFGILVWPKGETDDPAVIAVMSDLNFDLPNGVKLEMKKISAGTFMMGSPEDERGRFEEEVQHQVNLTNDFWLGQYEVMQAQYEAVMGTNPSKIKGNDLPVDGVSWDDAMAFCEKLNTLYADDSNLPAGYQFTLPTEAQWEYACRAGTTASLNNGKDISTEEGTCPDLDEVGWYQQNSDREPHSVGQKEPNAWGLYDMHGNVGEWCLDWYEDYPTDPVTDPKGPASASDRVMRGGSLMFHARYCRSACRGYDIPDCKTYVLGFRLALSNVQ